MDKPNSGDLVLIFFIWWKPIHEGGIYMEGQGSAMLTRIRMVLRADTR